MNTTLSKQNICLGYIWPKDLQFGTRTSMSEMYKNLSLHSKHSSGAFLVGISYNKQNFSALRDVLRKCAESMRKT